LNELDDLKEVCPSCQTDLFIEDMIRYVICDRCEYIKCPKCDEWFSGGMDGLAYHYYFKGCRLIE